MDRAYGEHETNDIAQALLAELVADPAQATVVGLTGDLGAGKTTLVQSIAAALGVPDVVVSPTFVIAKFYATQDTRWHTLIHIDAYRIDDIAELTALGWKEMQARPNTLIIIEWPERITDALPTHITHYRIDHADTTRHITHI